MMLAHLHAMIAHEESLSAAAVACMAKERHSRLFHATGHVCLQQIVLVEIR